MAVSDSTSSNGNIEEVISRKFSDAEQLDTFSRLLDRMDTIEKAVARMEEMVNKLPGMVAMTADMVDASQRQAAARGIDLEERMGNAMTLLEKLTSNETVQQISKLTEVSRQLPGLVSMTTDIADEAYRKGVEGQVDIEDRMKRGLRTIEKLTRPEVENQIDQLLQLVGQLPGLIGMVLDIMDEKLTGSNVTEIDTGVILTFGRAAGTALDRAHDEGTMKIGGLFSILRALRDPDRQKGMGFLMNFLKHLGRNIAPD